MHRRNERPRYRESARRVSPRLANRLLAELRQMFRFALVREIVTTDATAGIEETCGRARGGTRPGVVRGRGHVTAGETRALNLLNFNKHGICVLHGTLSRVGRLSRARITDIDSHVGTGTISAEYSKKTKKHSICPSDLRSDTCADRSPTLLTISGYFLRRGRTREFQVDHSAGLRPARRKFTERDRRG